MFDGLFGSDLPLPVKFLLAFIIVLALIVAATWLVRRFGGTRLGSSSTRGRQPRLAVIDAASVDTRRRLVLIRRDNVEHLLLIGGPSDIVIEQNIVRAVPVAPPREPALRGHAPEARPPELPPRSEPVPRPVAPEASWVEPPRGARPGRHGGEEPAWQPEPAARSPRPGEPGWTPAEPRQGRQGEPGPKAPPPVDLPSRPLPQPVTAAMRTAAEPARTPPQAKPAAAKPAQSEAPVEMRQSPPTADVNLADMAQRLEAALRRPARPPEGRDTTPRPEPRARPAGEAARQPAPPPAREPSPAEPSAPAEAKSEPPEPPAAETPAEPPKATEPPTEGKPGKSVFDSLEEEMANLLGRPPNKP